MASEHCRRLISWVTLSPAVIARAAKVAAATALLHTGRLARRAPRSQDTSAPRPDKQASPDPPCPRKPGHLIPNRGFAGWPARPCGQQVRPGQPARLGSQAGQPGWLGSQAGQPGRRGPWHEGLGLGPHDGARHAGGGGLQPTRAGAAGDSEEGYLSGLP